MIRLKQFQYYSIFIFFFTLSSCSFFTEGQPNRCETNCPYNIAYVCGSDGVTYSNECQMRAESCQAGKMNVFKLHDGECGKI